MCTGELVGTSGLSLICSCALCPCGVLLEQLLKAREPVLNQLHDAVHAAVRRYRVAHLTEVRGCGQRAPPPPSSQEGQLSAPPPFPTAGGE